MRADVDVTGATGGGGEDPGATGGGEEQGATGGCEDRGPTE